MYIKDLFELIVIFAIVLAVVLLAVNLVIMVKTLIKDLKKQSPFLMSKADINSNLRSLMLSINRSEYIFGYRNDEEYEDFIQEMDERLMEEAHGK
jgi:hypothetical protein